MGLGSASAMKRSGSSSVVVVNTGSHGNRFFRHVKLVPYRRRDGTETFLKVWSSTCVICGAPFEVVTPRGVIHAEQSCSFQVITCPAHRLTAMEALSLRYAKPAVRAVVFAAIKEKKLKAVTRGMLHSSRP
jgi:hypothetical protein